MDIFIIGIKRSARGGVELIMSGGKNSSKLSLTTGHLAVAALCNREWLGEPVGIHKYPLPLWEFKVKDFSKFFLTTDVLHEAIKRDIKTYQQEIPFT